MPEHQILCLLYWVVAWMSIHFLCFHFSVFKVESIANEIVYDIMKSRLATRNKKGRNDKRRTFIYMYQTGAFFGERRMDNGDYKTTRFNTCVMRHSN